MIIRYIKLLLFLFLLTCLTMAACNFKLLRYGVSQGYGQLRIVLKAKPVGKVLEDPAFPDSLKGKLRFIQEVRRFAIDSLGVNDSKNYTTVYNQEGKYLLWVVTACEPYRFKPKLWSFPFVGDVPYKGFFDKKDAEKERDQLLAEHYDTEMGPVGGWSTLGWFRDPILSNMLFDSYGSIAELIIHELTHATIYVKDSADYNENLASFIGEKGALRFLTQKYGPGSEELEEYLGEIEDESTYSQSILQGTKRLDSLYRTFRDDTPKPVKDSLKAAMILSIKQDILSRPFYDTAYFYRRARRIKFNNAYLMSFRRYEGKHGDFEELFRNVFKGNIRSFLAYMKEKYKK
jgi:predicted aminopeptidase